MEIYRLETHDHETFLCFDRKKIVLVFKGHYVKCEKWVFGVVAYSIIRHMWYALEWAVTECLLCNCLDEKWVSHILRQRIVRIALLSLLPVPLLQQVVNGAIWCNLVWSSVDTSTVFTCKAVGQCLGRMASYNWKALHFFICLIYWCFTPERNSWVWY